MTGKKKSATCEYVRRGINQAEIRGDPESIFFDPTFLSTMIEDVDKCNSERIVAAQAEAELGTISRCIDEMVKCLQQWNHADCEWWWMICPHVYIFDEKRLQIVRKIMKANGCKFNKDDWRPPFFIKWDDEKQRRFFRWIIEGQLDARDRNPWSNKGSYMLKRDVEDFQNALNEEVVIWYNTESGV